MSEQQKDLGTPVGRGEATEPTLTDYAHARFLVARVIQRLAYPDEYFAGAEAMQEWVGETLDEVKALLGCGAEHPEAVPTPEASPNE